LDNFNTPAAFKAEDENLIVSLAQQVALSLEIRRPGPCHDGTRRPIAGPQRCRPLP